MASDPKIRQLVHDLYTFLGTRFPVCCSSDEFVYFPQVVSDGVDWCAWDDLSPGSVEDAVHYLRQFRADLDRLPRFNMSQPTGDLPLVSLLAWVTRTLEEQFTMVRTHATQPTFALTVVTAGIVQALQSGSGEALVRRLRALPVFLDRAHDSLENVPILYRELGLQMARDVSLWLRSLGADQHIVDARRALEKFRDQLSQVASVDDFHLTPESLERVVKHHTGSGLSLKEAVVELHDETVSVRGELLREAAQRGFGEDWNSCYEAVPGDLVPPDGKKGLLRQEVDRLKEHCNELGFMDVYKLRGDSLDIEPLPPSLTTIRAADSYNATPGHPFRGGVFYIFEGGSLGCSSGTVHPVYRMTAAHEAYPGHHLLDLSRWSNPDAAYRPVEYPLFYEGWACFGEDLMLQTGAFDRSYDRLILLRRRYRHAVRGRIDLLLHSGTVGFKDAALELVSAGFTRTRAMETVRKYALRPAYQMCYTIGRRRFQRLFDSFGQGDPAGFVKTVLSSGELLFEDLEKVLEESMGHGDTETRRRGD